VRSKNISHEVTKEIYSGLRAEKSAKYECDVRNLDRVRSSRAVLDDNVLRECV
jgi:hypothetical protein